MGVVVIAKHDDLMPDGYVVVTVFSIDCKIVLCLYFFFSPLRRNPTGGYVAGSLTNTTAFRYALLHYLTGNSSGFHTVVAVQQPHGL
jgi:hypothetical protein